MGPFGPIEWLIIGTAVGMLARLFLPGVSPVGCLGTIFIGIAGAIIGGKLWEEFIGPQRGVAWVGSILVAMLLLAIFRKPTYQRYWG